VTPPSRSPGRFCWLYWQADMDIEWVYDVYRVTTCRPGRGILWRPPAYSLLLKKQLTYPANSD